MLIRPTTCDELLAKGRALFAAHHAEVGMDLSSEELDAPLDIDEDTFLALADAGILLALGLFTPDDELVGYAVGALTRHQFTSQAVVQACGLFVAPAYRKQGRGKFLLDSFEELAAVHGAQVHWHAKRGSTFETILRRRGAHELETVFVAKKRNT